MVERGSAVTVAHSRGATHGPSVGRQVVRAAAATLSALAVLGLVAVGIVDAGRIHELWYGQEAEHNPLDQEPANWPEHHDGLGTVPGSWPTWAPFWAEGTG